jgi:alpha-beta hydrolase superfamily lysophospholipase
VLAAILLTIYFVAAFGARRMLPMGDEHRITFEHEFQARDEHRTDWSEYLAIEERLAIELEEKIDGEARPDSLFDRYSDDSLSYPANLPSNWNRSYELTVPSPRGVAVMLHGLSDSPYSMLSTAQALAGAGYNVVVPRMPGHGFAVGGLVEARREDWTAAVRIAVRHATSRPGGDRSLLLVGYSNGALLALDFALRCEEFDELPCPDALVLMSPAIAVNPLAFVMNLHSLVSGFPYFENFRYMSVLPEVDPFKFTSFPKRSAWEIYRISRRMHKALAMPARAAALPPVLTFQSLVDNTVSTPAVKTILYDRLPENGSELVVYDVNRHDSVVHLMRNAPIDPSAYFTHLSPLDFGVTVIRNRARSGMEVDSFTLEAGAREGSVQELSLRWPPGVFSLSHIAIPFRSDDMVYGDGSSVPAGAPVVRLGAAAPRGESGVLTLAPHYFLRARHNPFSAFQERRIVEWLRGLAEAPEPDAATDQ